MSTALSDEFDKCYKTKDARVPLILMLLSLIGTLIINLIFWCNYDWRSQSSKVRAETSNNIKKLGGITLLFYCIFCVGQTIALISDLTEKCGNVQAHRNMKFILVCSVCV